MNIIAQLDQSIEVARQQGYHVRFDWFGGTGGGVCQVNGKKVLFIDLALSTVEQLEVVQASLDCDASLSESSNGHGNTSGNSNEHGNRKVA